MRTTRRSLLATAAASAAFAGRTGAAVAEERSGLGIALAARSPVTMNPQATTLGADNWVCRQVFDTLVIPDDGTFAVSPADFRPNLAETWESSPDAKTWTFSLRRGVKFHKGQGELSADDVAFTFGRQIDPSVITSNKVLYANIATVAALDPATVQFRLKRPDPLFCGSCIYTMGGNILPKQAFIERGDKFALDPIGTGAFAFERADMSSGITLTGHKDYFRGPPATSALRVLYILDTTARTLAFLSGQVDMIEGARTPGWMQSIGRRAAFAVFDATRPGSINTLQLNLTRKPLDDVRVRQAIRYAIDSKGIARAYGEMGGQMWGLNPVQFAGSVGEKDLPPELQYKYDPDRAKTLLAEAGFAGGLTIPCFTSQREDYAAIMLIVQEMLRKAGINLDMKIVDHTTMQNDIRKDLNSLALLSSSYPPVPTQVMVEQLSRGAEVKPDGSGGVNLSHYGSAIPGVDGLLDRAMDEPDFARRMALCQEIDKQVLRDLPDLGIITLSYVIARNKRVDLGYPVKSGYAYWPLRTARVMA